MKGLTVCLRSNLLIVALAFVSGVYAQTESPRIRVERVPVPGGAELDTLICTLPPSAGETSETEVPLVSVLVDTLGDSDPTNDKLRNIWVLTYARPSLTQRVAAGLPFVYFRAGSPHRREDSVPSPILDMGSTSHNTWFKLVHAVAQSEFLDPVGIPVRAPTRAYSGNVTDYRNEHIWHALNVLGAAGDMNVTGTLSGDEMDRIQARLLLSTHLFGDLVSEQYLPKAFEKERDGRLQYRQHNWELLRQKAEEDGLYFQPLTLGFLKDAHVLLWVERHPPANIRHAVFNSTLLGIANPFEGNWLEKWKGYTETWTLDEYGSRVDPGTPGSHTAEMVPLAVYSLDYPRAPLLLVDFREPAKPRRVEMFRRGVDQATTGILGLTTFGNLEYFAAKTTWNFVRSRQGATIDHNARLRAYSQLRHALFFDDTLDPAFRRDLLRRVDELGVNPFEDSVDTEARLAREQYAALKTAAATNGLAHKLDQSRSKELAERLHSKPALAFYRFESVATFGIYKHSDKITPELLSTIDYERRFAWHKRFLEQVIDSPPQTGIAYNLDQVLLSLDAITAIGQSSAELRAPSEELVRRVLARTMDDETRRRCAECLQRLSPQTTAAAITPKVAEGGQ